MIRKILLIGPLSPPITGNSLANDVALKGLKKRECIHIEFINTQLEIFKNNTGKFSFKKSFFYIKKYINLYKVFGKDTIYITPGQTFFGILKYAPFIYLAKTLNKTVIIHVHGNYLKTEYDLLSGLKKRLFSNILKKADKGVVLSKSLIQNLSPFLPLENIFIVPNFVEDFLRPVSFKIKKGEILKIVYLSNLMIEKGVLDVMEALKALHKREIKFEAKFAGNIESYLEVKLQPFFNLNEINYLGVVEGVAKKELLEWGNVFVLPTYYKMEGVPISILEAMSNGNIIITTEHGGIKDIMSEEHGFFVKPKSPNEVADRLYYINANLEELKEMRINNVENSQQFTEQKFIDNLIKVFIK